MSQSAPGLHVRIEFKPADCWLGVFSKRRKWWCGACGTDAEGYVQKSTMQHRRWDVWICILPMLPIHIWRERGQHEDYVPEPCLDCGLFQCENCASYLMGDVGGGAGCCCGRLSDPPRDDDEDYYFDPPEAL